MALSKIDGTNFVDPTLPVASGGTGAITLAAAGLANTPAFQAYASADADGTYATWTKVAFDTELFDTAGAYDHSTNYRFTPQTAGKYFVYTNMKVGSTTANQIDNAEISIYKNGSAFKNANIQSTSTGAELNRATLTVTSIIDFNGSSDYVEAYYQVDTSTSQNQEFYGSQLLSSFGAYRIIGV